jgi:hypothetical protein
MDRSNPYQSAKGGVVNGVDMRSNVNMSRLRCFRGCDGERAARTRSPSARCASFVAKTDRVREDNPNQRETTNEGEKDPEISLQNQTTLTNGFFPSSIGIIFRPIFSGN